MGLFDKIVNKATELGSEAAREASKVAEITPIRLGILGLQGSRQKLVEQLGEMTLTLYNEKQITHPLLDEPVAKIAVVEQEISAKEAQIQAIEEKYNTPQS